MSSSDPWLVVIDPQRIFASPDSPWGSPMFDGILDPVRRLAASYGRDRTVLTRWVPPARPDGSWAAYLEAWPFARVGDGRSRQGDPVLGEPGADEVAVGTGPVGAGVHARRTEPRGCDEHGHRAPGVHAARRRHHVLAARGQVGHLHDEVDERLPGVDHPPHASTSAAVASVICGG